MTPVTAVLVTYNSAAVVPGALQALGVCPQVAETVVVDNASTDGTAAAIGRDFPAVRVMENGENVGFGRANNRALAEVRTEFALLVNPDARVDAAGVSALLEAAARYPDAAILAPQLVDEHGHLHASYKRSVFARERARSRYVPPAGDLCAEWLSGAVWLLRMEALRITGFFDPAIFLYHEDDDLCLRVRAAGYACVLAAEARAVHLQGKSSAPNPAAERFRQMQMSGSRLYIEQKYHGTHAARRLAWRLMAAYAFKWLLHAASSRRLRYAGRLDGVRRFLRAGEAQRRP